MPGRLFHCTQNLQNWRMMLAETPKFYTVKKERKYAVPNWYDAKYKCVGAPKKVGSLHKVLKYMDKRKTTIIENDFGKW